MEKPSLARGLPLDLDKILLVLLVGGYYSSHYVLDLPQFVPNSKAIGALLLLTVGLYLLGDMFFSGSSSQSRVLNLTKVGLLGMTIGLLVVAPTITAIHLRRTSEPHLYAHDGLIQSEEATASVLAGLNPYSRDYTETPMADWPFREGNLTENPALFYYPYLPLTFLMPLPGQLVGLGAMGWFDHRILYLVLFIAVLSLGFSLGARDWRRYAMVIAIGLNPLFVPFFSEGRNDILVMFWVTLAVYFAWRKQYTAAAIFLALGCGTKQTAWLFVPAFFLLLGAGRPRNEFLRIIRGPLTAFIVIFLLITIPWFLLDPVRFVASTLAFQSGILEHGYPIGGYGLSALLVSFGVLESVEAPFPFWILQVLVVLPLAWFLLRRQARSNDLRTALTGYGILLFATMFFSRAFHDNHAGFVINILTLAAFLSDELDVSSINS